MDKKVPAGRLGRLARLGKLALQTGGALLDEKAAAIAADRAADVLGTMRGLAAKVGQMASYVDGVVPEASRDAFEKSLKVLRSQAPHSSPAEVRAVIESELGAPIDRLFASFDDVPMASASIGQVHRARLHDDLRAGMEVAVKVQHPGIRKAVESDLANAGILESMAGVMGGRRFDTKTQLATIRARFREELDYVLEGERLVAFGELHAGDPKIQIPRLVKERSAASVLTTELVHGDAFDDILGAPEELRRAYAETLWRFVFKGNLLGGMFNADPHPGNYFFQEDGRIAFVDYGCVQVIPEDRRPFALGVHRAASRRDGPAFDECVSILVNAKPGRMEDLARQYSRLAFAPLFESPFHITREYAAKLFTELKVMALAARKLPDDEVFAMPGEMLFMNRLQFGFYSVLARLDVTVDYTAVEKGFLPPEP